MAKRLTYDELSKKLFSTEEELRTKDEKLMETEFRIYTETRISRADLYDEIFSAIRKLLDQGGEIILRSKVEDMRGE